jgi:Zn finger protein HypA/HybF involved in hydrogenase expression
MSDPEPASHHPYHASTYRCLQCHEQWMDDRAHPIDAPPCPRCDSADVEVVWDYNLNMPGERPEEEA